MDREIVIKGLEKCKRYGCDDCTEKGASQALWDCPAYDNFIDSALTLLKEQEPVAPQKHYNEKADLLYTCGKCRNDLKPNNRNAKFCWFCGKPVLWK